MEFEENVNSSYEAACEKAQMAIISLIISGELTSIDGVMSPVSVALSARLGSNEFDINSWWVKTPQEWICPACGRKKIDLARLNTKNEIMCHLVEHHDHMKDVLRRRFQEISVNRKVVVADQHAENFAKRSSAMISAYENTLICVDCNNADVIAKKAASAHRDFSFSPKELRLIIKSNPNKVHEIDEDVAKKIWSEQQSTFELRIKIADRISEIAANNEHWFQSGDLNCDPDLVYRRASAYVERKGAYGILELLKGPKKIKPVQPASAWRKISHQPSNPHPTPNEIDHAGQVGHSKRWNEISEEWICPGCKRIKREIVRKNKDDKWMFSATESCFFSPGARWYKEKILVCGDCVKTAQDMGKEAALGAGKKIQGYTAQVNIQEVQRCVIPRPHARHNIDNDEVEQILKNIIYRLLQGSKDAN